MATTLMPLDPVTTPQRAQRLLSITANLLPDEIVAARRARGVRTRVLIALAVIVVLLTGWYALSFVQLNNARNDRDAAIAEKAVLQEKQKDYADVVDIQRESKVISSRLTTLMATDLRWANLLTTLRTAGNGTGVEISGVSGQLAAATAGGAASAGTAKLPGTATDVVGFITVTGNCPNKDAVAQYVDALSKLDQFTSVYLTSVNTDDKKVQFSAQLDITKKALGGRFTQGGK